MTVKNGHGGKVHLLAQRLGVEPARILDFSASINPLAPPKGLIRALSRDMGALVRNYPPAGAEGLIEVLASSLDLLPDRLMVGNGSTELIHLLPRFKGRGRALIIEPAFSEYRAGLTACGWEVEEYTCREEAGFAPDGEDLPALKGRLEKGYDLVFVGRPANPSGVVSDSGVILELARTQEKQGYLVVDQAFIDFCPGESLLPGLADHPALIILGSLTKFFGIPGLRLGFLAASEVLVDELKKLQPPWSVNIMAQEAGRSCLKLGDEFGNKTKNLVEAERSRLGAALTGLGLKVFPSLANYLLVRLGQGHPSAGELSRALAQEMILVRDCSNYQGLSDRFFRISVRLPEENDRLLASLSRAL